jgi:hypothetical protein
MLCVSHFVLHVFHFVLHASHFVLHVSHFVLHVSHFVLHASHFVLHVSHSLLHVSHSLLWASPPMRTCNTLPTMHSISIRPLSINVLPKCFLSYLHKFLIPKNLCRYDSDTRQTWHFYFFNFFLSFQKPNKPLST